MAVARWALLGLALFELLPLTRLLLGTSLFVVNPVYAPHTASTDLTLTFAWVLCCLVVARLGAFFSGPTLVPAVKWMMVALHAVEIPFFGLLYYRNVYPRRNLMAFDRVIETEVILGVITAVPFLMLTLPTTASKPKKA